jgi:hypothetical protein
MFSQKPGMHNPIAIGWHKALTLAKRQAELVLIRSIGRAAAVREAEIEAACCLHPAALDMMAFMSLTPRCAYITHPEKLQVPPSRACAAL